MSTLKAIKWTAASLILLFAASATASEYKSAEEAKVSDKICQGDKDYTKRRNLDRKPVINEERARTTKGAYYVTID